MKRILFFCIVLIVIYSCQNQTAVNDKINIPKTMKIDSSLSLNKICNLDNNLTILGDVSSFDFVDKNNFIVSVNEPAQVIIYNINGSQIHEVGKKGKGPYEYIRPSIVRSNKRSIYVWCSMQLKIIVYNLSGEPLKEFIFEKAIKDFVVYNDLLCIYSASGTSEAIINIYDMTKDEFLPHEYGYSTREHNILAMKEGVGGVALQGNNLLFAPSDELCIYKINLKNYSQTKYVIDDNKFKVEKSKENINRLMEDQIRLVQYMFESDNVTGLFCTDSYVVLKAETGKVEMDGMRIKDTSKRRQKEYVFDHEMKMKYAISAHLNLGCKNNLYSSMGECIYTLKFNADNESSPHYNLYSLQLLQRES